MPRKRKLSDNDKTPVHPLAPIGGKREEKKTKVNAVDCGGEGVYPKIDRLEKSGEPKRDMVAAKILVNDQILDQNKDALKKMASANDMEVIGVNVPEGSSLSHVVNVLVGNATLHSWQLGLCERVAQGEALGAILADYDISNAKFIEERDSNPEFKAKLDQAFGVVAEMVEYSMMNLALNGNATERKAYAPILLEKYGRKVQDQPEDDAPSGESEGL